MSRQDYYARNEVAVPGKESLLDKLGRVEEVGKLALKGYSYKEIAELKEISPATAKKYADEYYGILKQQAENDPDFMDRVQENTMRFLASFDEIEKEAWETVAIATDAGMVGARINALKLAAEISAQKARLYQLLGAKVDSGYIARMQRAETVNQILSSVIAEVVSDCEHCRDEAMMRLRDAYNMMGDIDRAIDAQTYEEPASYVMEAEEDDGEVLSGEEG